MLAATIAPAAAHRFWILPSSTVLSGDEPWVTFDAAISNNLFFPDHNAPPLESFSAAGPDGQPVKLENGTKGRYRTTFDIPLAKPGTYRISTVREMKMARWQEGGEEKNFRGSAADFEAAKIGEKDDVSVTESSSRVETFVTRGEPTTEILKPVGKGLEIVFKDTHPNDLFSGEKARFTLHLDGKPAANMKVTVIRGEDRYRTEVGEILATTNDHGEFEITFPEAGRYFVNASVGGGKPEGKKEGEKAGAENAGKPDEGKMMKQAPGKRYSYTAVFEVLPE